MKREEAIKNVLSVIDGLTPNFQETLRVLIPELAETDDERFESYINEACQFAIKTNEGLSLSLETTKRLNGWLEKQKEPLPVPDKFSGLKSLMLQYLQSAANRKDDAEIESDTDLFGRKILDYVWKHDEKQKEHKPEEWSEEDDMMLNSIIATCKMEQEDKDSAPARHLYEMQENWLKSLRPQPSGNLAISFMKYLDEHRSDGKMCLSNGECTDIDTAFKKEDWAKIIRYVNKYLTHYLWKPSEEQMQVLNRYVEDSPYLESLYNDLTKLM